MAGERALLENAAGSLQSPLTTWTDVFAPFQPLFFKASLTINSDCSVFQSLLSPPLVMLHFPQPPAICQHFWNPFNHLCPLSWVYDRIAFLTRLPMFLWVDVMLHNIHFWPLYYLNLLNDHLSQLLFYPSWDLECDTKIFLKYWSCIRVVFK